VGRCCNPHGGRSDYLTMLLLASSFGYGSPFVVGFGLLLQIPAVPIMRWSLVINLFIFPKTEGQLLRRISSTTTCIGFIRKTRHGLEIHKKGIILRRHLSRLWVTPYKSGMCIHVARLDGWMTVNPMLILSERTKQIEL